MSELSRDEARAILGPLSDSAIAEIIATGITKDELVAAHARVVQDRATHDHGPKLAPSHVGRVVAILERLKAAGLFGEAGSKLE